jgi:hypothetical protein
MKKIIFTIFLISSFSAVKAQSTSYFDTLTNQEKKMAFDYLVELYHKLEKTIKQTDSCHYNHEKYLFCEAINNDTLTTIASPWKFIEFTVISTLGDRVNQSVTLTLLLKNTALNQKIFIESFGSVAIDAIGNSTPLNRNGINVLQNSNFGTLFTNTPQKIELTFNGIMPGTEKFNLVGFKMSSIDVNAGSLDSPVKKQVEIRDIKIEW